MFHQRYTCEEREARNDNYPPYNNNTALVSKKYFERKNNNKKVGLERVFFLFLYCCYGSSMGRAPLCGRAFKATARLGWLVNITTVWAYIICERLRTWQQHNRGGAAVQYCG